MLVTGERQARPFGAYFILLKRSKERNSSTGARVDAFLGKSELYVLSKMLFIHNSRALYMANQGIDLEIYLEKSGKVVSIG